MTRAKARRILQASATAEHDAPIWNDDGRTLTQLAHEAGWRVVYECVDLRTWKKELRTVEATERDVF